MRRHLRQAHRPAAARSGPGSRPRRSARLGVELPAELLDLLATAGASTTGGSSGPGFEYRYTSAGAVRAFVEALPPARHGRRQPPAYRYERDVEHFFRHSPAVVRDQG